MNVDGSTAGAARSSRGDLSWPRARQRALQAGVAAAAIRDSSTVALGDAADLVLAADVLSLVDLPLFDTAAMDGWAVRGSGPWRVVGEARAGRPASPMQSGEAIRISTGAVVPPDSAVLRSEHGVEAAGTVEVSEAHPEPPVGADTRFAGEEVRAGEVVLASGSVLTPPAIGLVAAAGHDRVNVQPRARVAVFVLGDELVDHGLPGPGQVRDALAPQLPGWIDAMHATLVNVSRVEDSLSATTEAIASADADVVVTTGGTARGPLDHVRAALDELGGAWLVDGVAVRPGHPMKLATLADGRLWLALPGNPLAAVSALVTLGEPLLSTLAGRDAPRDLEPETAVNRPLAVSVEASPGAHRLIPAGIRGGQAHPVLRRGPAMLSGLASADVFVVVPPGPEALPAGHAVSVLPLPWGTGLVV